MRNFTAAEPRITVAPCARSHNVSRAPRVGRNRGHPPPGSPLTLTRHPIAVQCSSQIAGPKAAGSRKGCGRRFGLGLFVVAAVAWVWRWQRGRVMCTPARGR